MHRFLIIISELGKDLSKPKGCHILTTQSKIGKHLSLHPFLRTRGEKRRRKKTATRQRSRVIPANQRASDLENALGKKQLHFYDDDDVCEGFPRKCPFLGNPSYASSSSCKWSCFFPSAFSHRLWQSIQRTHTRAQFSLLMDMLLQ